MFYLSLGTLKFVVLVNNARESLGIRRFEQTREFIVKKTAVEIYDGSILASMMIWFTTKGKISANWI